MLGKDKFLEKISKLIFLIFIFFSQVLVAETTVSKIINYNSNLVNSSALFIQNDGTEIQEGEIYFGPSRIKINYKHPQNQTLILSERKSAYINHDLKETQYFNTNKSFIKFFIRLLKTNDFVKKPKIEKDFIKIDDTFVLEDVDYKITILYENSPIKIRKIMILENNQYLEMSFFNHKKLEFFDKNFFSMVDPYLNQ